MSDFTSIDEWLKPQVDALSRAQVKTLQGVIEYYTQVSTDDLEGLFEDVDGMPDEEAGDDDESLPSLQGNLYGAILQRLVVTESVADAAQRSEKYADEDTEIGWRAVNANAAKYSDSMVTGYDDRSNIDSRAAVSDQEGLVIAPNGKPYADGTYGWVIDEETSLLMLFDPKLIVLTREQNGQKETMEYRQGVKEFFEKMAPDGWKARAPHHTSPVEGFPIVGGGLVTLQGGYIVEITDESGHYRPTAEQQYAALLQLEDSGFAVADATVTLQGGEQVPGGRPVGKDWVAERGEELAQEGIDYPTENLELSAEQFQQTRGNEDQARLKAALNREYLSDWAVWIDDFLGKPFLEQLFMWRSLTDVQRRELESTGYKSDDVKNAAIQAMQQFWDEWLQTVRGFSAEERLLAWEQLSRENQDEIDQAAPDIRQRYVLDKDREKWTAWLAKFWNAAPTDKISMWDSLSADDQDIVSTLARPADVKLALQDARESLKNVAEDGTY